MGYGRAAAALLILLLLVAGGVQGYTIKNLSYSSIGKNDTRDMIRVNIGDHLTGTSPANFKPILNISRWDEVYLSILPTNLESGTRTIVYNVSAEKVSINIGANQTLILYNISQNSGYEYEIVWKAKPINNTIQFLLNMNGLVAYHQPAMNLTNSSCYNQSFCGWGAAGGYRPPNIVNSYAFYRSDGKSGNNEIKDLATGKVAHIERIRVKDAKTNSTWAVLNITGTTMTITVNRTWLNTVAIYPVTIDPLFGYTKVGGTTDYSSNRNNYITNSTIAIPAGTTSSISWYAGSPWGINTKLCMWKWADNSLAGCSGVTTVGTEQWYTANLVVTTDGDTKYWLGIVAENATQPPFLFPAYAFDALAAGNFTIETLHDYATPTTLNYNSGWSNIYASRTSSAYVTYTTGGGATGPDATWSATPLNSVRGVNRTFLNSSQSNTFQFYGAGTNPCFIGNLTFPATSIRFTRWGKCAVCGIAYIDPTSNTSCQSTVWNMPPWVGI